MASSDRRTASHPCCRPSGLHLQGFRSIYIRALSHWDRQDSKESWLGKCGSANTLEYLPLHHPVLIFLTMPCAMPSSLRPHHPQLRLRIRRSKPVHLALLSELPVHTPRNIVLYAQRFSLLIQLRPRILLSCQRDSSIVTEQTLAKFVAERWKALGVGRNRVARLFGGSESAIRETLFPLLLPGNSTPPGRCNGESQHVQ